NVGVFIPQLSFQDPPSDPPPPFLITAIAVDPANTSTLYFSSNFYGTYKSVNAGASWAHIYNGFLNIATTALAIGEGSTVYAGESAGVIKSTDGGGSWTTLTSGLPGRVSLLAIDPAAPSTLYSTFRGYPTLGGLFKSSDSGNTWAAPGLSNVYIFAL